MPLIVAIDILSRFSPSIEHQTPTDTISWAFLMMRYLSNTCRPVQGAACIGQNSHHPLDWGFPTGLKFQNISVVKG